MVKLPAVNQQSTDLVSASAAYRCAAILNGIKPFKIKIAFWFSGPEKSRRTYSDLPLCANTK
jgi:hypothetical protein